MTLHIVGGKVELSGSWWAVQGVRSCEFLAVFKDRLCAEAWATGHFPLAPAHAAREYSIIELIADGGE